MFKTFTQFQSIEKKIIITQKHIRQKHRKGRIQKAISTRLDVI